MVHAVVSWWSSLDEDSRGVLPPLVLLVVVFAGIIIGSLRGE